MSTIPALTPATGNNKKQRSAVDELKKIMGELVDRAAVRMSDKEFKKAEEESAEITARVVASHRETK